MRPTKCRRYASVLFLGVVMALGHLSGMAWWQLLMVVVLFVVMEYLEHLNHTPLHTLSVDRADGVWELGVYVDDEPEIWRGQLRCIDRIEICGGIMRLHFDIDTPIQMSYSTWVSKYSMDKHAFARLRMLSIYT